MLSVAVGMLLISEWWASEIMTILGGLLPDAERQLSAIAIYTTTNAMCFMLSLGISTAVATRYNCCSSCQHANEHWAIACALLRTQHLSVLDTSGMCPVCAALR